MIHYSHTTYVGNYGDVLKHSFLVTLLNYYAKQADPFYYIDTHAGFGHYQISPANNTKASEGIFKLWQKTPKHPLIQQYLEAVLAFNPDQSISHYPGSPAIAENFLKQQDTMVLFELYERPFKALNDSFLGKNVQLKQANGFSGCLGYAKQKGLLLIDPPYEKEQDYQNLIETLEALKSTELTIMIWYPLNEKLQQALFDPLDLLNLSYEKFEIHLSGTKGAGVILLNAPSIIMNVFQPMTEELSLLLSESD